MSYYIIFCMAFPPLVSFSRWPCLWPVPFRPWPWIVLYPCIQPTIQIKSNDSRKYTQPQRSYLPNEVRSPQTCLFSRMVSRPVKQMTSDLLIPVWPTWVSRVTVYWLLCLYVWQTGGEDVHGWMTGVFTSLLCQCVVYACAMATRASIWLEFWDLNAHWFREKCIEVRKIWVFSGNIRQTVRKISHRE